MKKPDCYIGIDPGRSGGIAIIDKEGLQTFKMPSDPKELVAIFQKAKDEHSLIVTFIEDVHLWHSDTRTPGKVFNMQPMLDNAADCRFALSIAGISYGKVQPIKWQRKLRLHQKNQTKKERKNRFKEYVISKYPKNKITLNTADAVCIAIYGYKITMDSFDNLIIKC